MSTFSMGCPVHSDMILLRFALWYMISFACVSAQIFVSAHRLLWEKVTVHLLLPTDFQHQRTVGMTHERSQAHS